MLGLTDKTALVTGGASGIGRSIGLGLAAAGVRLALTDIDAAGLSESVKLIEAQGGKAIALNHDVAEEEQWIEAIRATQQAYEQLHILVNCAGIFQHSETFSTPLAVWQKVMGVNAQGTFLGMKHAIPLIAAAGGGSVVNISSICGLVGVPQSAVYCASKGAIRLMTKAVALECAQLKNRVRVNSIHPGLVDTPSFARLAQEVPGTGGADEMAKIMVPIGEACQPEDVASLLVFLCSDGGKHITGAELVIDGGMTTG